MFPAQIFRNLDPKFDGSIVSDFHFSDPLFLRREPVSADSASHVCLPHKIERRSRGKTSSKQHGFAANRTLRGAEAQLSIGDMDFGLRQGIRLIFVCICLTSRGRAWRRAKREIGTRQVCIGRLLKVQIALALPSRVDLYEMIAGGP